MAGLGLLLYGALRAACGIGKAVENKQMKDYSYKIDEKGRPTWIDRQGNQYINGERVVATYDYDRHKLVYAGQRTGTVYCDPEQNRINRIDAESEKRKQEAIKESKLAYMRYDHVRKRQITCEISTGKFIAYLEGDENGNYKKYYLQPSQDFCHCHCKPEGVAGVPITREEFDGLNIYYGTHSAYDYSRTARQYYKHVGDTTIWNQEYFKRGALIF